MKIKNNQNGFTLIELILVVSIIGILAAVALPSYKDYTNRAKISEGMVLAAPVQKAIANYYDRWGTFPIDNVAATLARPQAYAGRYVNNITVNSGVITINYENMGDQSKPIKPVLTLQPAINKENPTGSLVWSCNHSKVPSGFELVGNVPLNKSNDIFFSTSCKS